MLTCTYFFLHSHYRCDSPAIDVDLRDTFTEDQHESVPVVPTEYLSQVEDDVLDNENIQIGPITYKEYCEQLKAKAKGRLDKLLSDVTGLEQFLEFYHKMKVVTEVEKIEELIVGKCSHENCNNNRSITNKTLEAGVLVISYKCSNGHSGIWSSSSVLTHRGGRKVYTMPLLLTASVLVSGNNFDKVGMLFNFLKLQFISPSTYHRCQSHVVVPAIKKLWYDVKEELTKVYTYDTMTLSGDGRMDSPGFCAKYCVYSLMDHNIDLIIDIEVIDKREVGGSSTLMERLALKRLLDRVLHTYNIGELVTDASGVIIKLVRVTKGTHMHVHMYNNNNK